MKVYKSTSGTLHASELKSEFRGWIKVNGRKAHHGLVMPASKEHLKDYCKYFGEIE